MRDNHLDLINFLDPGPEEADSQPTEEANTPELSEESNILDPSGEELRNIRLERFEKKKYHFKVKQMKICADLIQTFFGKQGIYTGREVIYFC